MFSMGGFHILFQEYLIYIYRMNKIYLTEVVLLTKSYNLQDFKDWLHWHLDIVGFNHAHIFDNESSVDIKTVCEEYGDRVSYELIKGWPDQYNLYNRYINNESKAWWVLPIDDDEFLYVGEKYEHNVNSLLLTLQEKWPEMDKLSIGWRNMFPMEFTEDRGDKSLIENATGWSNEVCRKIYPLWRQDNRWFKTITKTSKKWYWGIPYNGGHNPSLGKIKTYSWLIDGRKSNEDCVSPVCNTDDLFIAHFQYKSNKEWIMKCTQRISAANKSFNKNKPIVYKELYKYQNEFKKFEGMVKLWKQ